MFIIISKINEYAALSKLYTMVQIVAMYKKKLKRLVAERQLGLALERMKDFFEFLELEEAEDELILLSSQLVQTETSFAKGIIDREAYRQETNAIANSILGFLNRYFPTRQKSEMF